MEPRNRLNPELPIRLSTDQDEHSNPMRVVTPTAATDITPQSINLEGEDFAKRKSRSLLLNDEIEFPVSQASCLIIRCSHDGFSFRRTDITKLKTISLRRPRRRIRSDEQNRVFSLQTAEGGTPQEKISELKYDKAQEVLHKFVRQLNEKIFDVYHKRRNNEQRNYFNEHRPHLVGLSIWMSIGVIFLVAGELVDGDVDHPVTHDPIGTKWVLMLIGIITLVLGTILSILLSFWILNIQSNSSETLDSLIIRLVESEINKFNQVQELEQWKIDEDEPNLPKEQRPLFMKMSSGFSALWLQVDLL